MLTILLTRGRSWASRLSSVTPKTTRRITSRVRAFIRSSERNVEPGRQLATSARASSVTSSAYPRSAAPLNAGINSLRARLCSPPSWRSSECSPMIGPRIALPLPAWKISGSPAKISLVCSGRVKSTSGRPPGIIQTVKVSPNRRWRYGTNWCRNRSSPALWAKTGQRSPGGSWSRRTCGRPAHVRPRMGEPLVGEPGDLLVGQCHDPDRSRATAEM